MIGEIEKKVKKILRSYNILDNEYHIRFGYDCFDIIISKSEIFSELVDELKDEFENDTILIRVDNKGNLVLVVDANEVLMEYDMEEYDDCRKIVNTIIEEGGWDTASNYLASVMLENHDAYEQVLNSRIHGKTVREIIQK